MPSLADILKTLSTQKHRRTVIEDLINHLEQYRQKETAPHLGDLVTDGVGHVPDGVIEGVIEELQESWLEPTLEKIEEIEGMEVPGNDSKARKSKAKGRRTAKQKEAEAEGKGTGTSRSGKVRVAKRTTGKTRRVRIGSK